MGDLDSYGSRCPVRHEFLEKEAGVAYGFQKHTLTTYGTTETKQAEALLTLANIAINFFRACRRGPSRTENFPTSTRKM